MKKNIHQKIFNAINNWRLKLIEWERKWYNYIVSIQKLNVVRNNKNWFIIDVYDLKEKLSKTVDITIMPVCEFWCVHNKMFLDKY